MRLATPASRRALPAALTLAIASLAAVAPIAAAAAAAPAPAAARGDCAAPHDGYRACLRADWNQADDGTVTRVDATVTLLERVRRCRHHGHRRTTIRRGRHELATRRAKATCHHGVARWRTHLSPRATRGWTLHRGQTLTATWGGTTATARVKLVLARKR